MVRGDAVIRMEIERILNADNVDVARLPTARQSSPRWRAIPRGRAPLDFWAAYQTHVRAWERFAAAEGPVRVPARGNPSLQDQALVELGAADRAVTATFREVERIATRYGARIPVPADSSG